MPEMLGKVCKRMKCTKELSTFFKKSTQNDFQGVILHSSLTSAADYIGSCNSGLLLVNYYKTVYPAEAYLCHIAGFLKPWCSGHNVSGACFIECYIACFTVTGISDPRPMLFLKGQEI